MASSSELDDMFEQMHIPEGYKAEIVKGAVFVARQRDVHWQTTRKIVRALEDRFGWDAPVTSDVRIDFPGELNGFAPDVAKFTDGAEKDERGRWRYQDVEFVAEVISKGTAANDYGPKRVAYATAGIPVYLIADPYTGRCRVFTRPQDGEYKIDLNAAYGMPLDLTRTDVGITLATEGFPRD
ncbi:Uma2 family endonuclease [Streptomyces sioyaensis]|uniref:Uma2 family endonuclease n=1 Tax=Streptomyces sioyaensis TaxID=67364 RepID=UPI001F18C9B5|nr:Uma2 family endonuclease [Streptomyces sioyaensis]MCF3175940.1 Uma2 family endonuclease [Streptomyces sioyaensis]